MESFVLNLLSEFAIETHHIIILLQKFNYTNASKCLYVFNTIGLGTWAFKTVF